MNQSKRSGCTCAFCTGGVYNAKCPTCGRTIEDCAGARSHGLMCQHRNEVNHHGR